MPGASSLGAAAGTLGVTAVLIRFFNANQDELTAQVKGRAPALFRSEVECPGLAVYGVAC
jgi:hypothetical protein